MLVIRQPLVIKNKEPLSIINFHGTNDNKPLYISMDIHLKEYTYRLAVIILFVGGCDISVVGNI